MSARQVSKSFHLRRAGGWPHCSGPRQGFYRNAEPSNVEGAWLVSSQASRKHLEQWNMPTVCPTRTFVSCERRLIVRKRTAWGQSPNRLIDLSIQQVVKVNRLPVYKDRTSEYRRQPNELFDTVFCSKREIKSTVFWDVVPYASW
jgi:hypothetical protein